MNLCNWDRIAPEPLDPLIFRRTIRTPLLTVLHIEFRRGAIVPLHHHFHEQVTMLTAGLLRLVVSGEEIILRPGDVLRIPPDAPHLTEALEDSATVEIFTPAREDLACYDNAFLR